MRTASRKAIAWRDTLEQRSSDDCMLCDAERVTDWLHEDDDCWVAECLVCRTPMVVWRTHGLPDPKHEARLLAHLERVAVERYGTRAIGSTRSAGGSPTTGTRTRVPRAGSSTPPAPSSGSSERPSNVTSLG